jgi:hypothetical protein
MIFLAYSLKDFRQTPDLNQSVYAIGVYQVMKFVPATYLSQPQRSLSYQAKVAWFNGYLFMQHPV